MNSHMQQLKELCVSLYSLYVVHVIVMISNPLHTKISWVM